MFRYFDEITVNTSPISIFAIYKDVTNWRRWDVEIDSSSLEGEFATGTYGRLKPQKGPETEFKIVAMDENRSFTLQTNLPMCILTFEHELRPSEEVTRVIHRVYFDGPLSFLFCTLLGRQLRRGIPLSLRRLKRLAEAESKESAAA